MRFQGSSKTPQGFWESRRCSHISSKVSLENVLVCTSYRFFWLYDYGSSGCNIRDSRGYSSLLGVVNSGTGVAGPLPYVPESFQGSFREFFCSSEWKNEFWKSVHGFGGSFKETSLTCLKGGWGLSGLIQEFHGLLQCFGGVSSP